jgi:RNA polymerase sigma-70 factor (ECF subfamily)
LRVASAEHHVRVADIDAAKAGDEAAFTRIYRVTQPWLVKYVAVLAGPGADVEDLCAETWLQVCRDLGSFAGDGDGFRAWIVRIARNRTIDASRSRKRRPVRLVPPADLPIPAVVEASGEDAALSAMSTADALAAIAQLPTEQAEAVLLRAVFGLDAKSAAKMLGRRPGAVRTAAYRGLRQLASQFPTPLLPAQAAPARTSGPEGNEPPTQRTADHQGAP